MELRNMLSGHGLAVVLLLYFSALHLAGLFLFTRGFLLSRLALPDIAPSTPATTLAPTHQRAIVIIIDALRFDFLSPHPPEPRSPYHHGVLTLPAELTAHDPSRSFLFHSYADPPTATLQRLKGITTGSLPTFIDVGSNFHSSSSISEDSIINQLVRSPRFPKRAFMGDDTWLSIYPDAFTPNLTWPFDSFNVEDLHTVDAGVTHSLLPLLAAQASPGSDALDQPFQFLVAHFLGVDHVGHRLGPDHPAMAAKLAQMDTLLRQVVAHVQDDTLLVLLGDHGMDPKGDHGGDSVLEVSTTTWIYSPGPALHTLSTPAPADLTPYTTYPGSPVPARSVQQIDLVPTLSLLLGLPIPFNNLGAVIPELFWRAGGALEDALRLNAAQVWEFFRAYRASSSGTELDEAWDDLERGYVTAKSVGRASRSASGAGDAARIAAAFSFVRASLETCRSLWAQFDVVLIGLGLTVLLVSVCVLATVYRQLTRLRSLWDGVARKALFWAVLGAVTGAVIGWVVKTAAVNVEQIQAVEMSDWVIFGAAAGSGLLVLVGSLVPDKMPRSALQPRSFSALLALTVLALHVVSFTSNSFILWEDHVVPYLILTLVLPVLLAAPSSPTRHLQYRLLGFPLLLAACVRLMSISTVCREEQHPACHVTFYASSTLPVSPTLVLVLALPAAFFLPRAVRLVLSLSKSDRGIAPLFLEYGLRGSLLAGSVYWLIEQLESWRGLNPDRVPGLKNMRMILARVVLSGTLVGGYVMWSMASPCIELQTRDAEDEPPEKPPAERRKQLIVLGYTNSYGAFYLLFVLVAFAVVFATSQLTGQVVMALFAVALLAHLETTDSVRDVEMMDITSIAAMDPAAPATTAPPPKPYPAPKLSEIVLLALLGHLLFFTTGHQAVLSTIQWKSAFIGFQVVTYPFAPVLVGLNTVGPLFLSALCVPLLAMWQVSPVLKSQEGRVYVLSDTVKASVGFMLYHSLVTLSCAACAAWLRRHLMVWKVFAPRFMLSGVTLLVVDLGILFAVGVGSAVTCNKVRRMFGTAP